MPKSIPPHLSWKRKQRGNENAWSLPPPWVVSFCVINFCNQFISAYTNLVTVKNTKLSYRYTAKKHVHWVTPCHFGWDSQDHVPSDLLKHRSTWKLSCLKNEIVSLHNVILVTFCFYTQKLKDVCPALLPPSPVTFPPWGKWKAALFHLGEPLLSEQRWRIF